MLAAAALSHLPGVPNFRDVGGIPCDAGARFTRPGVLLRSASPCCANGQAVHELVGVRGVGTVLDLRSPDEALADDTKAFQGSSRPLGHLTVHVNLMDSSLVRNGVLRRLLMSPSAAVALGGLRLLRSMPPPPDQHAELLARTRLSRTRVAPALSRSLWRAVARYAAAREAAGAAYDERVAALLAELSLADVYEWILTRNGNAAGASAEEVAAEYARTDAWAATAEGRAAQEAMLPARLAARLDLDGFCRANPATLHELWRRVEARYGSVDGYMSAIGVAPATRAALRDALTAPRPPAEGGPAAGGERGQ
ncbi:hypothetical protein EMIHUDRAFT_119284 [Emiliania huxleyi CCMP1516]|uniref:Rhodanese domain-containing protein n=2 Tax=Emiliania huxleyi TaxID=2903 RepID=A0A0D3IWF8_EMIH1|nr:hypothetical protein EMIHUDRAFT_119284 [Emiliania huxleyi CCMP1516]EOD15593.1 hypothetical protein EMIHUDRAFT_119284 [Emiliania huxleyi CCMP1516]|eukprot:XP_005768022.1 hypothetical protein EMIHUDRAFT_119284 [Emiliania huxleyi CCMP1516]